MTCEPIDPGRWRLSFSEPEADFLINVLARLARHYAEDMARTAARPARLLAGHHHPARAPCQDDLQESQEVLCRVARAELRAERLALVENWMREFELAEERDPWQVEITSAERDEFVAMLNDRRMLLALEIGITEDDMEADPARFRNEARRAAILEIDVLGHFILVALGPQIYRP